MMREAKGRGAELVVFTELALTTFFPRWLIEDEAELDSYYEREMPGPETQPLFDEAKKLGIGFYLGYAELAEEDGRKRRFNTSILVDRVRQHHRQVPQGASAGPCRAAAGPHVTSIWRSAISSRAISASRCGARFGGVMGMCICNDRRWPETYRVMGLQGVEMVMLGYNTPYDHTGHRDIDSLTQFHNHLSMQAGAYQNSTWVIGTAKCGVEEGSNMVGQSVDHRAVGRDRRAGRVAGGRDHHRALRPRPRQALSRDDLQFRQAPRAGGLPADRRAEGRHPAAGSLTSRLRRRATDDRIQRENETCRQ